MISTHYALDVPRGCKIVNPVEYNNQVLADLIIERVLFVKSDEGGAAEITFTDGTKVVMPSFTTLTVDQGTPERQARVAWAKTILDIQ